MDRRTFLRVSGGAGAATLTLPSLNLRSQPGPDGWNVLMIVLEDLNDWIGCLGGHPNALTPNMDAFAASGVLFTHAYAASPACNPSRTAFFSGLHPSTTGCTENDHDWRDLIPDDYPMLPLRFRQNGYRSIQIGKAYHPSMQVFSHWHERWFGDRPQQGLSGLDPYLPLHPSHKMSFPITGGDDFNWGATDEADSHFFDRKAVELARARFNQGFEDPFFMLLGTHKTHLPWVVPREYFEKFPLSDIAMPPLNADDFDDVPPAGQAFSHLWAVRKTREHKQHREAVQAYLATINFLDDTLGRFLDDFNTRPEAQNTIVVMMADHGHHVGEKFHMRKKTMWEEASRSLLAIRVPGLTVPGGLCDTPVNLMDVYPTLAELCNLPDIPYEIDATSLVPHLMDPSLQRDYPVLMSFDGDNHAVRSDRWRYIRYADGSDELYDHDNDPNEWTNLAGSPDYAGVIAALEAFMPPGPGADADPAWRFGRAIRTHSLRV